jgi:hypothetical protein
MKKTRSRTRRKIYKTDEKGIPIMNKIEWIDYDE